MPFNLFRALIIVRIKIDVKSISDFLFFVNNLRSRKLKTEKDKLARKNFSRPRYPRKNWRKVQFSTKSIVTTKHQNYYNFHNLERRHSLELYFNIRLKNYLADLLFGWFIYS